MEGTIACPGGEGHVAVFLTCYCVLLPACRLVHLLASVLQGMLGAYAGIILLLLVLSAMTLLNCPAGLCFSGFSLNVALLVFCLIPLILTTGLLLMRDICGNMEQIASKAVTLKAGNSSLPAAVSQFYLSDSPANGNEGLPAIIKGINADYDVEGFKIRVQRSVDEMLKGVTDDFTLRPQVRKLYRLCYSTVLGAT